jgi:hypothetical protein
LPPEQEVASSNLAGPMVISDCPDCGWNAVGAFVCTTVAHGTTRWSYLGRGGVQGSQVKFLRELGFQ